jgi:hypothetical protein
MSHFQLLTCAAAASLLMGCASAPAVREAVNPQDRAQRSITNFSPALRCMDGLLFNAGVRDLTMVMDDMRDATQKVPVGARDMMTSAVSEMTRRSRAVRLSLIGGGGEGGNLLQALQQAKEANVFAVLPEYTLRGSISQIDEDVQRTTSTLGLTGRLLGLRLGNDARFSVMGLDAAMLRTESMTLVPGVVSKNTTVLRRQETGASDGTATLRSGSAVFSFATTRSEGTSQAARNMVELAAIEVVGKLTRLPYWQCLGMRDDEPEVQRETEDWFLAMDEGERISFVKERLRERRWYDGALDGQTNEGFESALRGYRGALGLTPSGPVDLSFFRRFVAMAVPPGPLAVAAAPLARVAAMSGQTAQAPSPRGPQTGPALPAAISAAPPAAVRAAVPAQSVLAPVALANLGAADAPIRLRMVPTARGQALVLNARQTGYVYCYAQDPATQAIRRIFPNRFDKDPRVVAGSAVALPGRGRFVLSADHDHACLFAEREVYGDLPAVLRWGDFQDVRARSFDEIRDRFVESTGAQIALVRAAPLQVARAAR